MRKGGGDRRAIIVGELDREFMGKNVTSLRQRIKTIRINFIASGIFTIVAPDLFGNDDKGVVVARVTRLSAAQLADARNAAAACPVAAIEVEDDVGPEE
jgi:ferredoxin